MNRDFQTAFIIFLVILMVAINIAMNAPKREIFITSTPPTALPKEKSVTPTTFHTPTMTAQPTLTLPPTAFPTFTPIIGPTMLPEPTGMFGAPSLWPSDINRILEERGSPAAGNGVVFWELGVKYGIDPAYLLAFFAKESSMGADPNWSGNRYQTFNIGNIICTQNWSGTCGGRFRRYESWEAGAEDWYSLMSRKYRGLSIYEILEIYAPASDGNNPMAYAETIETLIYQWRTR